MKKDSNFLRIGVFIDGTYFSRVSNYYLYEHERRSRISIGGLRDYIREEVAREEDVDKRFCQIVDAHYFRGRISAKTALAQDSLYRERQWDDVLIREGITMHFLPLATDHDTGELEEKGLDVWFAIEAYDLAIHKRFDISVLLTGDGDFVPLVRKLNTLGTRVMLLAWSFEYQREGKTYATRTSQALINEVTYPVMMSDEIDFRGHKKDPIIDRLFVPKKAVSISEDSLLSLPSALTLKQRGAILSLQTEKNYGFIHPESGGDNLFFHASGLSGVELEDLRPGDLVEYQVIQTDRGPNAIGICSALPLQER